MKIISYSFDVPTIDESNVSKISSLVKSIDMLSESNSQLSEVIITSSSHSNNHLLENVIADQILRSTSVNVVSSDKRSKSFTRATLAADAFNGDTLILTRDIDQMQRIVDRSNLNTSSNHLVFLTSDRGSNLDSKLFRSINDKYHEKLIDEKTFGLIVSRQAINSVMSSENDIYDLFTSLAVSNFDRSFEQISLSSMSSSTYSEEEILEILSKFAKTSYFDHLDTKIFSSSIFASIFIALASVIFRQSNLLFLLSLTSMLALYSIIDAVSSHLSMISRQSFASANQKYIAGNAVIQKINKKN